MSGPRPLRVVVVAGPRGGIPDDGAAAITEALSAPGAPPVKLSVHDGDWRASPAEEVDGLVCSHRYWGLAELPPSVRWVQVWGTGVDGLPPHTFADTRVVTCARGAGAIPISEFVLATMLAFEKDIPGVWVTERPEQWFRAELGGLHGRTLAVLGLGAIGSAVARLGLAFGMTVKGLRAHPGPSPLDAVSMARDPLDLVEGARHVVVTAPSTEATRHIVSAEVFEHIGPGAHLVNIARGALVDHDALAVALDRGRVARASLDVTDPEPLPSGHWLYAHPKVRISPHVSWSSQDGHATIARRCIDNIVARAQGRALAGVVDPVAGY